MMFTKKMLLALLCSMMVTQFNQAAEDTISSLLPDKTALVMGGFVVAGALAITAEKLGLAQRLANMEEKYLPTKLKQLRKWLIDHYNSIETTRSVVTKLAVILVGAGALYLIFSDDSAKSEKLAQDRFNEKHSSLPHPGSSTPNSSNTPPSTPSDSKESSFNAHNVGKAIETIADSFIETAAKVITGAQTLLENNTFLPTTTTNDSRIIC